MTFPKRKAPREEAPQSDTLRDKARRGELETDPMKTEAPGSADEKMRWIPPSQLKKLLERHRKYPI